MSAGAGAATLDRAAWAGLFRPRILVLVALQTAAGFLLERPANADGLLVVVLGTALVSAAGCALNHYLERDTDARMPRTALRPLVTGALRPGQVLALALPMLAAGALLVLAGGGATSLLLLLLAAAVYLLVYTPLKRRTSTNTWIGAIPGALPLLVGATAVRGQVSPLTWAAFALVFLWQLPHFFAIASMYRDDYRMGGLRMLSGDDPDDALLRWQLPMQVMSLVLVSLAPLLMGAAGLTYALAALAGGALFLLAALAFGRDPGRAAARRVVLASVAYLPLVLGALVLDARDRPDGPGAADALPVLGQVPDFALIAQDGKTFTAADMLGHVWVVDFIFTRCGDICVDMTARVVELQALDLPLRFLSVSIDPVRDTPPALAAYRERTGGDPRRWTLLTGDPEAIAALAEGGFKLAAEVARVEGMPPAFHSGKLALVDAAGRVRGYFDHDDRVELEALRRAAARLVADAAP